MCPRDQFGIVDSGGWTIGRLDVDLAYLWSSDGKWHIGQESKGFYEQEKSFYLSRARVGILAYNPLPPSPAAKKYIAETVIPLVQKWADENPGMILDADEEYQADQAQKKRETIAWLCDQIARMQTEIAALEVFA